MFAPTDEAFAALSTGTLEELRSKEVGTGRSALFFVLQHHVVAGRWLATQLREREVIGPGATEGSGGHGGLIMIEVDGDDVRVDGALVIEADIEASNG
ncbi:MAG: fasciclin domain-containing protein, partial [Nitrospiraceae bacterium]